MADDRRPAALLAAGLLLCAAAAWGAATHEEPAPVSGLLTRTGPAAAATDPPQPPLALRLLQYRRDEAASRVEVSATARADVDLLSVRLDAAGFDGEGAREGQALAAGTTVDLPVAHGDPVCGAPDPALAAVEVRWRDAAGEHRAVVEPADPDGVLQRVHDRLCGQQRVGRAVAVSLAADRAGEGVLRLERRAGDGPVSLVSVAGSVLYSLAPGGPLPALDPGEAAAEVPVRVVVGRCDPHAVAESKRSSVFSAWVAVPGSPEGVYTTFSPDAASRVALDGLRARTCGHG
ncbi:hypothetical protein [Vallicoccus soli]|uniref:Uncharacterized protein n=1 Tax=Vallicoccus soli TaxID=2339232 RepID=A0A3A3Z144_9ACTN|nr:hypothetical protein [Vallicoccus soli]RJK96302.1 hypothetical protein D5H78_08595 [Vallicoccus soli]